MRYIWRRTINDGKYRYTDGIPSKGDTRRRLVFFRRAPTCFLGIPRGWGVYYTERGIYYEKLTERVSRL
jgi:hypothetical protein